MSDTHIQSESQASLPRDIVSDRADQQRIISERPAARHGFLLELLATPTEAMTGFVWPPLRDFEHA